MYEARVVVGLARMNYISLKQLLTSILLYFNKNRLKILLYDEHH